MFETTNQLYMYHQKWGFNPSKNRGKWIEMVVWLRNHCDCWFMIAVCWLSSPKSNHSLIFYFQLGCWNPSSEFLNSLRRILAKKEQSGDILHLWHFAQRSTGQPSKIHVKYIRIPRNFMCLVMSIHVLKLCVAINPVIPQSLKPRFGLPTGNPLTYPSLYIPLNSRKIF